MKETISKVKRQPSEWERIIANEATDKELISKIYRQLLQLNCRKPKQPNQRMGRRPKQMFLQRRHTDGQQVHEKILIIANYQRNADQNYSEVSPHTSSERPSLKSLQITNAAEDVEKKEPSYAVGGNVNQYSHSE